MSYPGKVDRGIALSLLAGIVFPVIPAVQLSSYWLLALPAVFIFFLLGCVYPQISETASDALIIRTGLTRRRIPRTNIVSVSPSSDSRNSVALSDDRLLIEHSNGSVLIAPENEAAFLNDVASHCPQLSRRGADLVVALK